ncbi:hypothetical protein MNV49_000629 [Pseudohyphozyma bogoriensis]|nr:hypothetical protein MNV49_000629 [Pseudohyphozyma bogoriensis]
MAQDSDDTYKLDLSFPFTCGSLARSHGGEGAQAISSPLPPFATGTWRILVTSEPYEDNGNEFDWVVFHLSWEAAEPVKCTASLSIPGYVDTPVVLSVDNVFPPSRSGSKKLGFDLTKSSITFTVAKALLTVEGTMASLDDPATRAAELGRKFDELATTSTSTFSASSKSEKVDDSPSSCDAPYHEIAVTDTAYTTYRAVLCWIHSSHIDFARLSSSFRQPPSSTNTTSNETRLETIQSLSRRQPFLPLAASPKSVYRLAHFLSLPRLMELALASIKSQLTPQTVAYELFSTTSEGYEEVREVCLAYAAKHWSEVKESAALEEIHAECVSSGRVLHASISLALAKMLK